MILTIWAWLSTRCAAAPVELPAGEPPAPWQNPLALAGLEAGVVPEGAPGARFGAGEGRWWLWVRSVDGTEHVLQVPAPRDARDREAIAALAASLVHPVQMPEVPLPARPPEPPEPAPRHEGRPLPEALAVSESPSLVPAPPPPLAHPSAPAGSLGPVPLPASAGPPFEARWSDRAAWRWWGGGGPSLRMRPTVRSVAAGGAWAGIGGRAGIPVRAGLGIEAAAPAELLKLPVEGRMAAVDLRAIGTWAPGRWELGPAAGLSLRSIDAGTARILAPVPTAGAVLARRLPIGPSAIRIALLVEGDLRPSDLFVVDNDGLASVVTLQPVSAGLGLSLWTR